MEENEVKVKKKKRMCRGLHTVNGEGKASKSSRCVSDLNSARAGGKGRNSGHVLTLVFSVCVFKMRIIIIGCVAILLATQGITGLESCIHGGLKYNEGEHFAPNDTVMKAESPHQCVQCRCLQGLVLCEIENCPLTECEVPVRNPQFCCLQCPGTAQGKEKPSDFVIRKSESDLNWKKNTDGDCISNGMHFKNGSVWQPVIGPFGVMACVQCRCQEGSIICARLECGALRCAQPRRELGQCCPVCPTLALNKKKAFCLPKSSELFVFKTPNVRNNSDRIEYAFLENKWKRDLVKIHSWNLRAKTLADVFTFSIISRKEFQRRDFQILGSATRRRFRNYSKREKKLKNNCLSKCFLKISRLENSLLDFAVSPRIKCAEDEMDVVDI